MKYIKKSYQEGRCIVKDNIDMNLEVMQERDNNDIQKVYKVRDIT